MTTANPAGPRIRLASPDIGEEEVAAATAALTSGVLTNGPFVAEFERVFARRHEVQHAVALANGTVALAAIYLGLGIGPGDEVVVPSLTFISTATSVLHVGATPVFAEVEPETLTLDPADVAAKLSPRTKAVVTVHYGGQPGDLNGLLAVSEQAGVVLIEDAAQAHGATYGGRPVGGFGRAAMFSFTPTKNITTGEGGLITTDDGDLADRLRLLRNHGQTALYRHSLLGWNWRMSEMQAAVGTVQVAKLDQILARKAVNAVFLRDRLSGVEGLYLPAAPVDRTHPYMLYTVRIDGDRDAVMADLAAEGIESRLYFPPAHAQPVFSEVGSASTDLPVTDLVTKKILSLPFHSRLTAEDLDAVADTLIRALERHRH